MGGTPQEGEVEVGEDRGREVSGGRGGGVYCPAKPRGEIAPESVEVVEFGRAGEVGEGADEEAFVGGDGVVNGELSGGRDGGVKESGGDEDGDGDVAGGGGGVEVAEDVEDLRVGFVEGADGLAAADALELDAEGMVAEGGYVEEGAFEAWIPGEGEGADAAAETAAEVGEVLCGFGDDVKESGGGGPEVGDAVTDAVGVAGFDALDDMGRGMGGPIGMGGAIEAAGAGVDECERFVAGKAFVTAAAAAVAVGADDTAADGGMLGDGEPTADAEAVEGGVFDFEGAMGIGDGDFAMGGCGGDGEGGGVEGAPELDEIVGFGRGTDLEE